MSLFRSTRRHRTQHRLAEAEELYSRAVRQVPGFIWTTDEELRIASSNGGVSLAPMLPHEAITGARVDELAASVELFDAERHRIALSGEHVQYETSWAGRNYLVRLEPFHAESGKVEGCIGIALDLTERRTFKRAIAQSDGRFRALIENSLDVTMILDPDQVVRYASPSIERVLGWTPAEFVGTKPSDYWHPEEAPELLRRVAMAVESPGATELGLHRVQTKTGGWRLVETTSLNLVNDPQVRGYVNTLRDVTERNALEERLRAHERLEAIGQLAGGVAHDFNNVLLVIRGYASFLETVVTDESQLSDLAQISKAADRAAGLTRQLLAVGRREVAQPKLLSVPAALCELEWLLRGAVPERITLDFEFEADVPPVFMDPSQLEQVLLNLVVNSRDAVEKTGTIVVRVGSRVLAANDDTLTPPLASGSYVVIEVADDGCGMSEEVLSHVFEPFFTTKAEVGGTGLGLATLYGIVTQIGGSIGIETSPGEGTTITLMLPASPEEADATPVGDRPEGVLAYGTERILLVEDEEAARMLVERVLADAGYEVETTGSPSEALQRVRENGFDLLLTDVVMPEMSGFELAARALTDRPDLPVLFVSSYAHDANAQFAPGNIPRLLRKPFTPAQLTRAVRAALDEAVVA